MSQDTLQQWVESHRQDYAQVEKRLSAVRNVVLHGPLESAASILQKSYMFAVLSIQTELDRHERAFTAHYAGDLTRKEAALETVYGGNKISWIEKTFESTDWLNLALVVRAHVKADRWGVLLDTIDDNLVGVSHRKGSFMLAMCGFTEYMCIDSNVARYAGLDESASGQTLAFDGAFDYFDTCETIQQKTGLTDYKPFIIQWAIYDYERGEHARHMAYFREAILV